MVTDTFEWRPEAPLAQPANPMPDKRSFSLFLTERGECLASNPGSAPEWCIHVDTVCLRIGFRHSETIISARFREPMTDRKVR